MKEISKFICVTTVSIALLASGCGASSTEGSPETVVASTTSSTIASISNTTNNAPPTTDRVPAFIADPQVIDLNSKDAVAFLNTEGLSGEELCKDRHRLETGVIPDYAEDEIGGLVPKITSASADIYATGAAALIYKSYETRFAGWENPVASHILCLARVIAEPRLEKDWITHRYLVRHNQRGEGAMLPFLIKTVGVRSGEAFVIGCFSSNYNGKLYDASGVEQESARTGAVGETLLFESVVSWIGGRWRVQTVKDYPEMTCGEIDELTDEIHQDLFIDVENGLNWFLSPPNMQWQWNEEEIRKWIYSEN